MIDLDREMRALLEAQARTTPPLPEAGATLRRTRRRQVSVVLLGAAVVIVAVIGSLAGVSAWIRASERPLPLEPRPISPGPLDAVPYGFAWNYQTTVDIGGAVWAIGPGLTRFDPRTGETRAFTLADDPSFQYVSSIAPAREGGVWIIPGTADASIRLFDGAFHEELPVGPVCRVSEGPDGTLWGTGCDGGLYRWDGAAWRSVPTDDVPVAGPILAVGSGSVWVANLVYGERETTGFGVSRFDGHDRTTWTTADGLPSDEVETIAEGPGGEMWVGTADGVAAYRDGSWVAYTGEETGVEIVDAIVATEERVWIAGWSGQVGRLAVFDRTSWTPVTSDELGDIGPHPSFAGDGTGTVWLATDESGLYRFDGSEWSLAAPAGLRPDVSRITAVSTDEVWSTGDGYQGWGGLWRLREDVWTEVPGAPGGDLNDAAVAPDGSLWVATSEGLSRFDGSTWERFASGPHRAISIAAGGQIWVSSGRTIGPIAGKTLPGPVPLPEPASVVEIGPDGEVWAGCPGFTMATGCLQTVARFDGRTWETLEPPPLTDGAFLRDLEVTPQGDVWITAVETTDDGRSMMTPARYRDGTWTELVATDTGVPLDSLFEGYTAAAIESTPDGSLLLVSHDGVFTLEQDRWVRVATGAFSDLSVAPDGAVWLGGDGIFRLRDERP